MFSSSSSSSSPIVVIALLIVLQTTVIASQNSPTNSDPRCAAHTCEVPKEYEIPEEFTSDDTTCAYGCPKCLVGPEWDQRRQELGTGSATRTFTPSLIFGDWLSTEMTETAFRILAEEMMDYKVDPVPAYVTGFDILCCERDIVYMEKWPGETYPNDDGYFSLSEVGVGYEGGSSIYVTKKTLDAYPLATAYNAYNHLPEYSNIFDRAGATPCGLGVLNETLGCVADNMQCTENDWTNTSCSADGRYVPPQCQGANYAQCQEILLMYPLYESGFFEGLIKNSGMKFSMFYVGYDNLISRVQELQKQGKHAIFYGWEPDPMIAQLNAQPIVFKTPTAACRAKETSDPTTNGGDCDYGRQMLKKVARVSSLAKDSDFKYFFESFALTNTDLSGMMRLHEQAGGNRKVHNITCEWLRNNYGTWKDWIRNTPDVQENVTRIIAADSKGVGAEVIAPAVIVPIAIIAAIVGVLLLIRQRQIDAVVKHAPRKTPLTLIFTDVESSTSLWEQFGSDMATAMEMHHEIIREAIDEHQCYEVKTIGDSFMIACPTLVDGMMLSLAIQRRLHSADWPHSLRHWKTTSTEMEEGPSDMWNGLRVRIGIHYCLECDAQFDRVHGRYDYYGHDVNVSARVESMSQGGQILMISDTHKQLIEDPDFEDSIGSDVSAIKFATGVELKGVSEAVTMYSCVPSNLIKRRFYQIGETPQALLGDDSSESGALSALEVQSILSGGGTRHAEVASTARLIFNSMSKQSVKDSVLADIMKNRKVDASNAGTSFQRKLKALINNLQSEVVPTGGESTEVKMINSVMITPTHGGSKFGSAGGANGFGHRQSHTKNGDGGTSPQEVSSMSGEQLPGTVTAKPPE